MSDADAAFRARLRRWLAEHPPPGAPGGALDGRGSLRAEDVERQREWQRTLADGGWAGIAWPREFGGVGATPAQQLIYYEELERAGGNAADLFFVGISHAGPTIAAHGTPEQQARYLSGILRGDLLFCQCFSEPGAGSDLAALSTRAAIDGDHLVVTGEKRWSSFAQYADHCEMLVRTDTSSRHGGLTFVIGDMRAPGVDVRPLRAMDGEAHFAEVFFDGVRIPLTNVIGDIGAGWTVATTTLLFERSTAFAGLVLRAVGQVAALAGDVAGDPVAEAHVGRLAARALATRALLEQTTEDAAAGRLSPAASALKLASSELYFDIARYAAERGGDPTDLFSAFGLRIVGGTSEIQRTIIGERVLGLPREPSPARGGAG